MGPKVAIRSPLTNAVDADLERAGAAAFATDTSFALVLADRTADMLVRDMREQSAALKEAMDRGREWDNDYPSTFADARLRERAAKIAQATAQLCFD